MKEGLWNLHSQNLVCLFIFGRKCTLGAYLKLSYERRPLKFAFPKSCMSLHIWQKVYIGCILKVIIWKKTFEICIPKIFLYVSSCLLESVCPSIEQMICPRKRVMSSIVCVFCWHWLFFVCFFLFFFSWPWS